MRNKKGNINIIVVLILLISLILIIGFVIITAYKNVSADIECNQKDICEVLKCYHQPKYERWINDRFVKQDCILQRLEVLSSNT